MKPDEIKQFTELPACLKETETWMTCNFLLLNSDKTEMVVLDHKHLKKTLHSKSG